ncbi:ATP-dependent helicase [Vibrio alginolyticus]|uniref:UvrD-helicase domain-containing protein n=1 Tax=Vibrio TaxID=662 RepID=UPI000CE973BE|nr:MULTISPECIES: UvrD-helicase domain-containing protein [Vibrio]AVF75472.1 Fis family transcriptional regulator [Vibrio alginolyticus]MCA2497095.1 UvrD-helicase domain-containing protein [Vibrio alginolyticus]MCG6307310.1 UvrD-helicase domain-containing protein [Vibrio alginolyticus]MDW2073679.1 UvrD-helicase domain-containing protein [Vibrio sp. 1863]MDW2218399.1 UvrD-helicase domain-containing protein [Vibrio sp. 2175-1]
MSEQCYLAGTKPIGHDNKVDEGIRKCLSIGSGKSFITFAGAGSGKTYSLKKALEFLKVQYSDDFILKGKQIAVVTFTNNAADEIKDRIEQSPIFAVSTIHSFCWSAIAGFNEDIRKWYLEKIPTDLEDLEEKERKGRPGKASDARKRDIIRLTEKLEWLAEPRSFIYDPNGVNSTQNALSHADVLKIFSHFLTTKPMMAEVIINKFPFIFIDESQDTDKDVVGSFFELQEAKSDKVVIGLFGDTMQRIFGGGEPELGKTRPSGWTTFDKKMNHRSARRIVGLGNQIRSEDDKRKQFARNGAAEGYVRYFLLQNGLSDKDEIEAKIRETMAELTGDADWTDTQSKETAILLLEHAMAGPRLGFNELREKLTKSKKIKDRIYEGENTELNFFSGIVLPMAEASRNERRAELMSILRENKSPLLEASVFDANMDDPLALARAAEHAFRDVVSNDKVNFREVLEVLAVHNLLRIPAKLQSFVATSEESEAKSEPAQTGTILEVEAGAEERDESEISAWAEALETDFFQIRNYKDYIDENSVFRTHQGVKGNEFDRVMVIMDDNEAGGFLFSYEQFFGAKELSQASKKKRDEGEETGLDRTRRLFYVTSTRAKNSLAHIIYTSDVTKVRASLIEKKFARDSEIIEL